MDHSKRQRGQSKIRLKERNIVRSNDNRRSRRWPIDNKRSKIRQNIKKQAADNYTDTLSRKRIGKFLPSIGIKLLCTSG